MTPTLGDRAVRFALAGCGRVATRHFEALGRQGQRAELVSVCDVDSRALDAAVADTGAKGYARLDQLLEESPADVIVLATPSGRHAEQTCAIAATGRHVVTEKPMATRWLDARRMVAACEAAGVRLFVVKQLRHHPTVLRLKRAVAAGRFGRIYMVTVNVFWSRPQSYYDGAPWRGTRDLDGGALMNQASHYVDLLDWLIGPVESVQAETATLARRIEAEDTATLLIRWHSGALGSMSVTMLTYPKNLEASITVVGEKGTVRVAGAALDEVQHWEFAAPDAGDDGTAAAGAAAGHWLVYDNVIKTLRGEAEPETDGREGLKSMELLAAAHRAARDGRRVTLPLDG